MINFRTITDVGIYRNGLFEFIKQQEAVRTAAYLDTAQPPRPTIGIGFNLRDSVLQPLVISSFGLDPESPFLGPVEQEREQYYVDRLIAAINGTYATDSALQSALDQVMADRAADPILADLGTGREPDFRFDSIDDPRIRQIYDTAVKTYEGRVDSWLAGIPDSTERQVLVSLSYNGLINAGISPSLRAAVLGGDRAEAWYEIRYNSNGGATRSAGIALRRYRESDRFSLYDDRPVGSPLAPAEAKAVERMYTAHHIDILAYEANLDGLTATPAVPIPDQIAPARSLLVTDFGRGIAIDGEVWVGDDNVNTHVVSSRYRLLGSTRNDLILGEGGDDEMQGGDGNDVLYGGTGQDYIVGEIGDDILIGDSEDDVLDGGGDNDRMEGGTGYDTYHFRFSVDGHDQVADADGSGKIVSLDDGITLSGGRLVPGQSYYESNDGNFRYFLAGATLTVTKNGSEGSITVENFNNQRRTLGIYLDEDSSDPLPGPGGGGNDYNPPFATLRVDPLALDLNDDGRINTIALGESSTYFDVTGDGVAERIGWIDPADGLLAYDANGNGYIDGISEVFGGTTGDGFQDLAAHDADLNGVIDAADPIFSSLRVWQDVNRDGISQAGEIQSLDAYEIESVSLTSTPAEIHDNENIIAATGSYVQGGQQRLIGDVLLAASLLETNADPLRSSGGSFLASANTEIFELPWLRGYGDVADLHIAYDSDPALIAYAQSLAQGSPAQIANGFDTLLYKWSGLEARHQQLGQTRPNGLTAYDRAWIVESIFGQTALKTQIENSWQGLQLNVPLNQVYTDARYQEIRKHYLVDFVAQNDLPSGGVYYSLGADKFTLVDAAALQGDLAYQDLGRNSRQRKYYRGDRFLRAGGSATLDRRRAAGGKPAGDQCRSAAL